MFSNLDKLNHDEIKLTCMDEDLWIDDMVGDA